MSVRAEKKAFAFRRIQREGERVKEGNKPSRIVGSPMGWVEGGGTGGDTITESSWERSSEELTEPRPSSGRSSGSEDVDVCRLRLASSSRLNAKAEKAYLSINTLTLTSGI